MPGNLRGMPDIEMPFTADTPWPMGLEGGFDPRSDVFNRLLETA